MQTRIITPAASLLCTVATILAANTGCTGFGGPSKGALAEYESTHTAVQQRLARSDSDVRNASFERGTSLGDGSPNAVRQASKNAARQVTREEDPEHVKSLTVADLAPEKWGRAYRKATGRGPDETAARGLLNEANDLFDKAVAERTRGKKSHKGTFLAASEKYKEAAVRWPNSGIEEEAFFKSAESLFFADHYAHAKEQYDELLKKYKNTPHLDAVSQRRFVLAQYWLKIQEDDNPWLLVPNLTNKERPWADTYGHAIKVLSSIPHDDPGGDLADDALMLAANTHFQTGNYHGADVMYDNLRKLYPKSEFQFKAHLLSIKCKEKLYEGHDYDSTPLTEAEELIKQVRRHFPRESREHDQQLSTAWKRIRHKHAKMRWELGQYYERRGEYGGARHHYVAILEDFAETNYASPSRERMTEIKDKPHTPPNHFKWITDFVDEEERRPEPLIVNGGLNPYYYPWK